MSSISSKLVETPEVGGKVSRCMVVNGSLKSCEAIIVDGSVNGDITSESTVVIQKGGIIRGKIEAKKILLAGFCEGPLEAEAVEVVENAQLTGYILATKVLVAGNVDGDILARESLEIETSGQVTAYECTSQEIVVKGGIRGDVIAQKVLDIRTNATIEGDVQVKELKTEGSGKIFGTISRLGDRYEDDQT